MISRSAVKFVDYIFLCTQKSQQNLGDKLLQHCLGFEFVHTLTTLDMNQTSQAEDTNRHVGIKDNGDGLNLNLLKTQVHRETASQQTMPDHGHDFRTVVFPLSNYLSSHDVETVQVDS